MADNTNIIKNCNTSGNVAPHKKGEMVNAATGANPVKTHVLSKPNEVKRYLMRPGKLVERINWLEDRIGCLRSNIAPPTSQFSKPIYLRSRGTHSDPTGNMAQNIADLEEQLKNTENELYVLKSEILLGIGRLGNTKRQQVIQWHFLEYMTVEDIAEQLNVSKRYVYKMLNESYQILADKKAFSVKRASGAA